MLNEQTGWPTIPGKFSWVNSSGGLDWPTVPVLEEIGVASPPLIGLTYPSAHQQAPSTIASLYGWGAQCCWGKVTNTCDFLSWLPLLTLQFSFGLWMNAHHFAHCMLQSRKWWPLGTIWWQTLARNISDHLPLHLSLHQYCNLDHLCPGMASLCCEGHVTVSMADRPLAAMLNILVIASSKDNDLYTFEIQHFGLLSSNKECLHQRCMRRNTTPHANALSMLAKNNNDPTSTPAKHNDPPLQCQPSMTMTLPCYVDAAPLHCHWRSPTTVQRQQRRLLMSMLMNKGNECTCYAMSVQHPGSNLTGRMRDSKLYFLMPHRFLQECIHSSGMSLDCDRIDLYKCL